MSNKKLHRARKEKKITELILTSDVDTSDHDRLSRSHLLTKSLVAASAFRIIYLVPHLPQDIGSSSIFGWYTEGLHEAAAPLISVAEMPADIREPFTDRTSMLIGRLSRQISRKVSPVSIDSLAEDSMFLNSSLFKIIVSNNAEVSKIVDSIIPRLAGPTLHISVAPGVGRILPKNFTSETIQKYCKDVVIWMGGQEKYKDLSRIARVLLTSDHARKNIKVALPRGFHNLTTPNETALQAFGYRLPYKDRISEPFMSADVRPERYVSRICESADLITNTRRELLQDVPSNIVDHRYILAVQSFYWGHFGGFRKRISDADGLDRAVLKLIFSGTVQASTYFDIISIEEKAAFQKPLFRYMKTQQQADAASFTAGLTTMSSQTLVPVLRLEPKLNHVRGDLKQIGSCARSNGHGRRRKLPGLIRKLGLRMRDLVHSEFVERIDAAESGEIEGMKLVADVPLEFVLTNNLALSLRYDVSRLPVLPGNLYLANCMAAPVTMPISKFQKIIVIRSFSEDDVLRNVLEVAIENIKRKLQPNFLDIRIVDVANEDDFVNALQDFDGAVMIFDGHGAYKRNIGSGELVIGGTSVDAWALKKRVRVPPVVLFSACDTQPIDGSHSSAATAAFALGAKAVIGTILPINGIDAGVFVSRLLLRINDFVPIAVKAKPLLTWREVVSGMIRMSHVTDALLMLKAHMADIYGGWDFREVQMAANIAINNRDPSWHDRFVDELSKKIGRARSAISHDLERWASLTESLKYVQLGNPENIVIVEDGVFQDFRNQKQ